MVGALLLAGAVLALVAAALRPAWLEGRIDRLLVAGSILFWTVFWSPSILATDATTYLAAGERLNGGGQLYALRPGDRPVDDLGAPWTPAPLVYPPPIAVLWRPLAALPVEVGLWLWWLAAAVAVVWSVGQLVRAGRADVVLLLGPAIGVQVASGNVNGFLVAGCLLAWRGRADPRVGALVATMAALKLAPAALLVWLAAERRWRALGVAALAGLAIALLSLAGAGLDAHLEYLRVLSRVEPLPLSAQSLYGIPAWLVIGLGLAATVALAVRGRPGLAFAAAVLTMTFGPPSFGSVTPALLLGALAPLVPERGARATGETREPVETETSGRVAA